MQKHFRKKRGMLKDMIAKLRLPIIPLNWRFGRNRVVTAQGYPATEREVQGSKKLSTYIILALFVFFTVSLVRNISNVRGVEKKISDKEAKVEKLKQEQAELEKQLEYTKSQEFIEKQLRDKLGMAKEGEIIVVLPPPDVVRKFAPKHEEEQVFLPDPNWKKWMKLFI